MVNPKILCTKHLLGIHVELHMIVGTLQKKKKIDGYIQNNLIEPLSIITHHSEIVQEMNRRGMNHQSPLPETEISRLTYYLDNTIRNYKIDKESSLIELLRRCPICSQRFKDLL
jgi:hypothetical protein